MAHLNAKQSDLLIVPGSLIVVTGANGYIGSLIVEEFLARGYRVRGTVRSVAREKWVKDHFEGKYPGKFELFEVSDMATSGAFDEAVKGASGLVHVATPVMQSSDPEPTVALVVNSTINLLESAAKEPTMKRVVLTSSSGASANPMPNKVFTIDSNTWNEAAVEAAYSPGPHEVQQHLMDVYYASKTKGEQAAWKWMREHSPHFTLNTVLPCFNIGPPIDPARQASRTTLAVIKTIIDKGEDLTAEDLVLFYPHYFVDTRDDAALHVAALVYPDVSGERLFAYAYPFTSNDVLRILKSLYPHRKFAKDVPDMGQDLSKVANERAEELLKRLTGHGWTKLEESVRDTAAALVVE